VVVVVVVVVVLLSVLVMFVNVCLFVCLFVFLTFIQPQVRFNQPYIVNTIATRGRPLNGDQFVEQYVTKYRVLFSSDEDCNSTSFHPYVGKDGSDMVYAWFAFSST